MQRLRGVDELWTDWGICEQWVGTLEIGTAIVAGRSGNACVGSGTAVPSGRSRPWGKSAHLSLRFALGNWGNLEYGGI